MFIFLYLLGELGSAHIIYAATSKRKIPKNNSHCQTFLNNDVAFSKLKVFYFFVIFFSRFYFFEIMNYLNTRIRIVIVFLCDRILIQLSLKPDQTYILTLY